MTGLPSARDLIACDYRLMAIRVLQVFATPYATRLLLRDALYRGDNAG